MSPEDRPDVSRMSRDCPNCGAAPYGGVSVELSTPSGKKVKAVACYGCGTIYRP